MQNAWAIVSRRLYSHFKGRVRRSGTVSASGSLSEILHSGFVTLWGWSLKVRWINQSAGDVMGVEYLLRKVPGNEKSETLWSVNGKVIAGTSTTYWSFFYDLPWLNTGCEGDWMVSLLSLGLALMLLLLSLLLFPVVKEGFSPCHCTLERPKHTGRTWMHRDMCTSLCRAGSIWTHWAGFARN